jgi:short-subunit dehydrogenase
MNNYNPFNLKDKTILITGASSGLGVSIAVESSKMGSNTVIIGRNKTRRKNKQNHDKLK